MRKTFPQCEVCAAPASYRCAFGPRLYHFLCSTHRPRVHRFKVTKQGKVVGRRRGGLKMTKEDVSWSRAIKERDGRECQWCHYLVQAGSAKREHLVWNPRGLHSAHVFSRGRQSTRTDLDNGVTLCWMHHRYLAANEIEFHAWIKSRLGDDRWERLSRLANQSVKKIGATA